MRTVSQSFWLERSGNVESEDGSGGGSVEDLEGTIVDKGGVVSIDFFGDGQDFGVNGDIRDTTGPIITNREFHPNNRVTLRSAFVTNSPVSMRNGLNLQGVLITSSQVLINTVSGNSSLNTVVLKRGGSIHIDVGYISALSNVNHVLVPDDYIGRLDEIITHGPDRSIWDRNNSTAYELLMRSVIFYRQDDFDPWNIAHYSDQSIRNVQEDELERIFGPHPDRVSDAVDYRQFFRSDFILKHLDDPNAASNFKPDFSLPAFPEVSADTMFNQTGEDIRVMEPGGNEWWSVWHTVISAQSDFLYNQSIASNADFNVLDFSEGPRTVYSFRSFEVNAPRDLSGNTLTIDVGSKDVKVVTESLLFRGATIRVVGEGTLTFYVTGTDGYVRSNNLALNLRGIDINAQGLAASLSDILKVRVFVGPSRGNGNEPLTLRMGDNTELGLSVYAEDLNVEFSMNLRGSFISLNGTHITHLANGNNMRSTLIYAPKALFRSQGADVSGHIIVSNIQYASWGTFTFGPRLSSEFMQEILSPLVLNTPSTRRLNSRTETCIGIGHLVQWGPTIET